MEIEYINGELSGLLLPSIKINTMYGGTNQDINTENMLKIQSIVGGHNLTPIYEYNQLDNLTYIEKSHLLKIGCHSGQRKLLLSEIEFYATYAKDCDLVIYAGSAPCEHLPVILEMFPNKKFLLIDPNYHSINYKYKYVYQNLGGISLQNYNTFKRYFVHNNKGVYRHYLYSKGLLNVKFVDNKAYNVIETMTKYLKNNNKGDMGSIMNEFITNGYKSLVNKLMTGDDRIYIIQDYMTKDLSELLYKSIQFYLTSSKEGLNVCFVSDIRTNLVKKYPVDIDYIWNDALQMIFVNTIKPSIAMIKFHPPYYNETDKSVMNIKNQIIKDDLEYVKNNYNLDMITNYKERKHLYFSNKIIFLQAWAPMASTEARLIVSPTSDYMNYDNKEWDNRFMYFKMLRGYGYFGLFYEKLKGYKQNLYDGCLDCALEIYILMSYLIGSLSLEDIVNEFDNNINKLFKLRQLIDENMIYPLIKKCDFHGQLTNPPNNVYFYEIGENISNNFRELYQLVVRNNKINRKKAMIVKKRNGDVKYNALINEFKIADNVDSSLIPRNQKTNLAYSILKYPIT